jgi:hypothetical protein
MNDRTTAEPRTTTKSISEVITRVISKPIINAYSNLDNLRLSVE